jgi:hypothetical protein
MLISGVRVRTLNISRVAAETDRFLAFAAAGEVSTSSGT